MNLTPEQLETLKSLGISSSNTTQSTSNTNEIISDTTQNISTSSPSIGQNINQTVSSSPGNQVLTTPKSPIIPLLSVSGLTLISLGGLILFKDKSPASPKPKNTSPITQDSQAPVPTQVPKSIQHYLLTSQQFFSQALQYQSSNDQANAVNALNQSLLAATESIKLFPQDFRGYDQRGKIYQSLLDGQPELLAQAISDLTKASELNPTSADLTRSLATLYARKGDAQNTIAYLNQTITIEPTKAQNFYDLAKLQQQAGYLPQALNTYQGLLSLVTDPTQKQQLQNEITSLQQLVSQNPNTPSPPPQTITPKTGLTLPDDPPSIQANANTTGLIIAAPETSKKIEVSTLTESNSLSGTATLPSGQKEITLQNTLLTSTSQVYLSLVEGGKNQNLQVLSKTSDSFTIGFDAPLNENVTFKWWIVNP